MKKIIFLDVDGTLVNYSNQLIESAVIAIRNTRKNGNRVYICTGRSKAEVYPELWEIGLDGMIGGNGSYVEDDGQVLMHRLITPEQTRQIVDWLHERGLEFYLESCNGLFASEHFEQQALDNIRLYSARKGQENASLITVREAFPDMIFGADLYRSDLSKISYVLRNFSDFTDAQAAFPEMQCGTWGGAGETALFGDFGVKNITKASAVNCLLEHLKAQREDTIAFGDAKSDIPMFEACAYSVCMGNGGEETKAAADYITDDVDNDGLYKAFAHLNLI